MSQDPEIRVVFFGTPDFSVPALRSLLSAKKVHVLAVVTQPDRPAGRGQQPTPSPVKQVALEHRIPVIQPENIRSEITPFLSKLSTFSPVDLNIVIAFGQILPLKVLNFPKRGSLNIHASLLPRWRGAAPIQRALISGDKETGICLMQMEKGLDTGAVFAATKVPILESDDFGSLHDKLANIGAELLLEKLQKIVSAEIVPQVQSADGVTYAKKIENSESEINWNNKSVDISNLVRALSPVPGAYTFIDGKRIKLFSARTTSAWPDSSEASAPGTIARVENDFFEVLCGEGGVALESVQLEGKRRLGVKEFLKGYSLRKGMKLGRIATF